MQGLLSLRNTRSAGPLAGTLRRVGAGDPDVRYRMGVPREGGWTALDDALADDALLDGWLNTARASAPGLDAVAASFLASWLAGTIVGPLTVAMIRERRAWPSTPGNLLVHHHPDGWFDGLAVRRPEVLMLPGDANSGHRDAIVVADLDALRQSVAGEIAASVAMIFEAIGRHARLSRPGVWGAVADAAAAAAVADAAARGGDLDEAFAEAMAFADAIAAVAPVPRVRPSLVQVPWSGGVGQEILRGTCCQWYRTQPAPDPSGEGYCSSCPRRDPEDQRRRWASWRETEVQD